MYNSPQIAEKRPYNTEKSDVFSLGVVLMILLFRNPWFRETNYKKDPDFK